MTITLRPENISSLQHLETTLLNPARRLHVISGIAVPDFVVNDEGQTFRGPCEVYVGVSIAEFIKATCQVGLASIVNGDSAFTYSLYDSKVEARGPTNDLVLTVQLGLRGEDSALERFGFQIVALAGKEVTGVSGHIRWSRSIFDASQFTDGAHFLAVTSNLVEPQVSGGPFPAPPKITPLGGDGIVGGIFPEGDEFFVPYEFDHLPLNVPLLFTWRLSPAFPQDCVVGRDPSPDTSVRLTPSHMSESGVNFHIFRNPVR